MIRRGRPSDLPAIRAIEASAATVFVGTAMDFAANMAPNPRQTLIAAIERDLLWVAESDGVAIGFLFAEPAAEGLYLRELAVAAEHQKQGIGRALMIAGIAAARARGDRLVMLTTDRMLPFNAPFYARLGFVIVEGDAIPIEVQRRLSGQYAVGFDPARRCAMVLSISPEH